MIIYFLTDYSMERRRSFKKTEMGERVRFLYMWLCGLSLRCIAERTGTSATTVRRWVRRWQIEGDLHARTPKPKSNCFVEHHNIPISLKRQTISSQVLMSNYFLNLGVDVSRVKIPASQLYPRVEHMIPFYNRNIIAYFDHEQNLI